MIATYNSNKSDEHVLLTRFDNEVILETILAIKKLNKVSVQNTKKFLSFVNDDIKFAYGNKYFKDSMKEIYELIYAKTNGNGNNSNGTTNSLRNKEMSAKKSKNLLMSTSQNPT